MPFIPNSKYKDIYKSAKDGNEKAQQIIQGLRKGSSQEDLDLLLNGYYNIGQQEQSLPVQEENFVEENPLQEETPDFEEKLETPEEEVPEEIEEVVEEKGDDEQEVEEPQEELEDSEEEVPEKHGFDKVLGEEMEGLLDENDIEDTSFNDFLGNKAKNALRQRKNNEYFKLFDPAERADYMNGKINDYKKKFDGSLSNIDRRYNDMAISLDAYSKNVALLLDDGIDLSMDNTAKCYDELINDKDAMSSFGRYWDENDTQKVNNKLADMCKGYGKNNVMACLNTLKSDNEAYRDYSNNQIDQEISRYSKSISDLLK